MDYIKDREIRKLEKKLDKKNFNSDSIVVGYKYIPPLEVIVPEEKRVFNKVKEDMYIENMINSYIFIFGNVRFDVDSKDFQKYKEIMLDYFLSINQPFEYAKSVLRIVENSFAHSKTKSININDLIDNVIVLKEMGYNDEDLNRIKQNLTNVIGQKIVSLDTYKRR